MRSKLKQATGRIGLASLILISASANSAPGKLTVDSKQNVQHFYGVPVDLTISGLRKLPYRVKMAQEMGEGDLYPVAWITAKDNVEVKASFDLDGRLYYLESSSPKAVGPKGIKVGSFLSDVQAAWPTGRLLYGSEDGRFVTFSTDTNVKYVFDPADLPPQAFDHSGAKIDIPNIRVRRVRIFARY